MQSNESVRSTLLANNVYLTLSWEKSASALLCSARLARLFILYLIIPRDKHSDRTKVANASRSGFVIGLYCIVGIYGV